MTFSITALCPRSGQFGVAISSSSPAVAARCAHARAGVGAVATQNITDPRLGTKALDLLGAGHGAEAALRHLVQSEPFIEYRQVAVVDASGGVALHSGARTLGTYGTAQASGVAAAGNLLAGDGVPGEMLAAFLGSEGSLAERLLRGLEAGVAAGGEAGPVHSAGLLVVRDVSWPLVDLRVDWEDDGPIARLRHLWTIYAPQADAYVTRALNPASAPSYGVAGDP